jgi:hypothetical protein
MPRDPLQRRYDEVRAGAMAPSRYPPGAGPGPPRRCGPARAARRARMPVRAVRDRPAAPPRRVPPAPGLRTPLGRRAGAAAPAAAAARRGAAAGAV